MRKKILLIIESSETGGAENVFAELVNRLDLSVFHPHVALLYKGWLYDKLRDSGVTPVLVPTSRAGFDVKLYKGIGRLVKGLQIDLIHSHLFTTNVYASVSGALARVPVISTFHGIMDVAAGDRAKRLKWLAINRFSSHTVFVSKYLRDFFVERRLASAGKARVIYNGIDLEKFGDRLLQKDSRTALKLPADCFVVGCLGDLRPAKDYGTALRAVALLKKKIPNLMLIIAGSKTGMITDLELLSDTLGVRSSVRFIGFHPAIETVLPAFDIYLSSSTTEGFSLTTVEAMAAGLPVVSTRSGGPEEIVRDGLTGLLVDVGSPEKIAEAIDTLYREQSVADALAVAGRQHVGNHFSVQTMVDNYQDLYRELLSVSDRKNAN